MDSQDLFEKIKQTLMENKVAQERGFQFIYDGIYMLYFKINGFKSFIRIKENKYLEIGVGDWCKYKRICFVDLKGLSTRDKIKEIKTALKIIELNETNK